MTAKQWERVESARLRLRDASFARADPYGQVWRLIFGEEPLTEGIEPGAVVFWSFAQLAFLGEWLPRGPLEGCLAGNGQALGLSCAEIASCFAGVLEVVEQVGQGRPDRGD